MLQIPTLELNWNGLKTNLFSSVRQEVQTFQEPEFSIRVIDDSQQSKVTLEIYNDRVVKIYSQKSQYLLFDFEVSFGYSLKDNRIWFHNRETKVKQSFFVNCQKDLTLFIDQLKRKCSQQNFSKIYQILEEQGKGKNSMVYVVKRKQDNLIFAAKQIKNYGFNFIEEIQILKQLEHPNLIFFREFFIQENGKAYIVMDYEDGGSLLKLINAGVQLTPKQKIKIITDMLNALEFLRLKGIVHRDLKPENILFSKKDGNYKIADFGISRRAGERLEKLSGTPGYIAPELFTQNSNQLEANIKSDVYSMGLIFYQILTLKQYYQGSNSDQILKKNMSKISFKKKQNKGFKINSMQFTLLEKMIRTDPEKRKNSLQILKSAFFNKVNKIYSLDYSNSTSPTKKIQSDDLEEQINQDGLMDSFLKLLRIRSWSN